MSIIKKYKKVSLLTKLLFAMIVGVILGAIFGEDILFIKPLGSIFLNLLKMAALPLIIFNLISGISSLDDPKMLGRVGGKIMLYYAFTTVTAICLGIFVGYVFKPGIGFILQGSYDGVIQEIPTLGDTIVGLIPSNIFAALTAGSFDQIIVFSAFVGIAILFLKEEDRKALNKTVTRWANLFNKLIGIIMGYAPIGIGALMASVVGQYGKMLFGFMAKYLAASYVAIFAQCIVYFILLIVFAKMSPKRFIKDASPLVVTAFSTSSSLACVPVSLDSADKLGVPRTISGFTIPLGAQVNKDGNGIMIALTFIFAAQSIANPLSIGVLLKVVFLALILTTGAGGVPGGGIVSIAIIIDAFGLPLEIVAIVSGIFALIDMGFTTMNVLGDLTGTVIVSELEKKKENLRVQDSVI